MLASYGACDNARDTSIEAQRPSIEGLEVLKIGAHQLMKKMN